MQSYKDLTKYFGLPLLDSNFQSFIKSSFSDLTDYNVTEGDYMVSEKSGIELGFINKEALFDDDDNIVFEHGNPIFSHVTIYPVAALQELPFKVSFADNRNQVIGKAGQPLQTQRGEQSFLYFAFLVDNYKVDELIVTFDYQPKKQTINFVQIRDNNLVEHLKL